MLHFPPFLPYQKNISKKYQTSNLQSDTLNQPSNPILGRYPQPSSTGIWGYGDIGFVTYGITGDKAILAIPAEFWYDECMSLDDMMLKQEIAEILDKASYRIWDTAKVIKNQDYHDGVVKGLKMASNIVSKL